MRAELERLADHLRVAAINDDWPTFDQCLAELRAIAARIDEPKDDTARMDWMERHLVRAGEVRNAQGQCVKLARVWSIMGELPTLRETVDAAIVAYAAAPPAQGGE